MILNNENVLTVEENAIVQVYNPATDAFTPCRVELGYFDKDTIYLTTLDSRVYEFNHTNQGFNNYSDYIQHFRNKEGAAIQRRDEIAALLINKQYTIS
jgi:hypothetical protein